MDNTVSTAVQVTSVVMDKLGVAVGNIWDAASKMAPTAMEGVKYAFLNMCKYKMACAIGFLIVVVFFWIVGVAATAYFGPKLKAHRSEEFRIVMSCLIGAYFFILAMVTAFASPSYIADVLAPEGAVITELVHQASHKK